MQAIPFLAPRPLHFAMTPLPVPTLLSHLFSHLLSHEIQATDAPLSPLHERSNSRHTPMHLWILGQRSVVGTYRVWPERRLSAEHGRTM
jgi:hypothetical protein